MLITPPLASQSETQRNRAAPLAIGGAVALLAVFCYLTALPNEFAFDDWDVIYNNELVRQPNLVKIFSSSYWWGGARQVSAEYRPLTIYSFALNYAASGLNPMGYHLINLLLHALTSLALLMVLGTLFGMGPLALWGALLFAVHPVHTEAVANIVGRSELLSALFFFGGLWAALGARQEAQRANRWGLAVVTGIAYLLGLLSKETAVTLPAVVLLSEVYLWRQSKSSGSESSSRRLSLCYPCYALFAVALVAYLGLRWHALGGFRPPSMRITDIDNVLVVPKTAGQWGIYYATAIKVTGLYFVRLFLPVKLSGDYSYPQILPVESVADIGVLMTLLFVGALVAVAVIAARRRNFIPAFALLFFFITFAPVSNFFIVIGTIMGERLVYLPSVGVCLLVAWAGVSLIQKNPAWLRRIGITGAVLVVLLGIRTMVRNLDWHDELTFWEATARTSPRSCKVFNALGQWYLSHGETAKAEEYLLKAVELRPNLGFSHAGLAQIEAKRGDYKAAEDRLRYVLGMEPRYLNGHFLLAGVLADQKHFDEAIAEYQQVISIQDDLPEPYYYLGRVYLDRGEWQKAEQAFGQAIRWDPQYASAYVKRGKALAQLARYDEARRSLQEALQTDPEKNAQAHAEAHLVWGNLEADEGNPQTALTHFNAAITIAPQWAEGWLGLAKLQYVLGSDRRKAIPYFLKVLELDPNHPEKDKILKTLRELGS
ncbi:MAG: tetratricopeptide repeat protein [bacterium]